MNRKVCLTKKLKMFFWCGLAMLIVVGGASYCMVEWRVWDGRLSIDGVWDVVIFQLATIFVGFTLGIYLLNKNIVGRSDGDVYSGDYLFGDKWSSVEVQNNFQNVFYNSVDAIAIIKGEVFIDCNEACVNLLRAGSRVELLAVHPSEFSPEFQDDGVSSFEKANVMIAKAFEEGFHRFEWTHTRMDGEAFPAEISLTKMRLEGEDVLHVMWKDLSDQKKLEQGLVLSKVSAESANEELKVIQEELEAALQMAEEVNISKSDFLANMSHEIRTPMTAILGYADLLCEPELRSEHMMEYVNTIRTNGKHLLTIINDILDISKIEAGKMDIESIECSIIQVSHEVASLVGARARGKNLNFDLKFVGEVPEVIQSDPTRLRQILINLVGNAIKFTEIGSVEIVVKYIEDEGGVGFVEFKVIDTGIGLTEEQIGNLFQAFSQADTSTTRKFGGTGLGLSISKKLAIMLGGDIRIESEVGVGSSFIVTTLTGDLTGVKFIKDTDNYHKEVDKIEVKRFANQLRGKILLAEDGPDNQRLISHHLKKAGADVMIVENGKLAFDAALSAVRSGEAFDVILMDMQMPVMDGYTAVRELRRQGYRGQIVALTANAMSSDRAKCLEAGCNDYATKPIDSVVLIEAVSQCFEVDGEREAG